MSGFALPLGQTTLVRHDDILDLLLSTLCDRQFCDGEGLAFKQHV